MPVTIAALNAIQGPGAQVREIGPQYDLMLATRDGTTLPCRNKDGDTVNIAKLALMTSVSNQNQQHEETELQHKDQLVQLSSPNLVDREFDLWPQVSQGDWSGGMLQRVFTGATPVSGGTESDPTRYWDGTGVVWPISDYVPQAAVLPTPISDAGGLMIGMNGLGVAAGYINSVGESYAFVYEQNAAPNNIILVVQSGTTRNILTNPAGPWAAGNNAAPADFFIGHGVLWYWWTDNTPTLNINFVTVGGPTVTAFATIAGGNAGFGPGGGSVGMVGNRRYLAVPYATSGGVVNVRLYDITTGTNTSFVDIEVGDSSTVLTSSAQFLVQQTCFLGDNLMISVRMGSDGYILQYNIASTTSTVVARFPNEPNTYTVPVAGALFVLSNPPFLVPPNLYLLQGGSLQNIGPLVIQTGTQVAATPTGISHPEAFGPYAIFAVSYVVHGTSTAFINVYAYDVLRGRLFRIANLSGLDSAIGANINGKRIGTFYRVVRPFGGSNVAMQWGVLIPTISSVASPANTGNAQECFVNVSPTISTPPLQSGVDIISSLIDFTSAQNKLYRQVVASFTPLPNDAAITVRLQAWLDQDPGSLSATPDFDTGLVTGGGANVGVDQIKLQINKVARKLVYRVTTTGPSTILTPAVKLQSVVVRAATGWTRTFVLDLADDVGTNGKAPGTTAWSAQQPPGQPQLDAMVARDFLRQLWRLEGGECVAVFPGYDPPANWLLQDFHFDSPKPFGVSFRSDQRNKLEYLCQLKLREDV